MENQIPSNRASLRTKNNRIANCAEKLRSRRKFGKKNKQINNSRKLGGEIIIAINRCIIWIKINISPDRFAYPASNNGLM